MRYLRLIKDNEIYYFPFFDYIYNGTNSIYDSPLNLQMYYSEIADMCTKGGEGEYHLYSINKEISTSFLRILYNDNDGYQTLFSFAITPQGEPTVHSAGLLTYPKFISKTTISGANVTTGNIRKLISPERVIASTLYGWRYTDITISYSANYYNTLFIDITNKKFVIPIVGGINNIFSAYATNVEYMSSYSFPIGDVFDLGDYVTADKDRKNPLEPGGISGPGGGTGNFDNDSDPIDIPNLPTLSASDTGLVKLYVPTLGEVRSLSNFLWSDLFSVDSFKKLFQNPMDAILGLSIIPCVPTIGGRKNCVIGNIDSGVEMSYASSQYVTVDCGTLNINEYWGSALDYSPYTLMQIYLPYIGSRTLNIDEVMNKTLHLVYHIDISNGSCVALIKSGGSVLYQFNGNVATVIPISGNDWSNTYRAMLSIVGSFAGGMIGAGVGMQTGGASGLTGSYALNAIGVNTTEGTAPLVEGGLGAISSGAKAITHAKQIIDHSGNMAGSSGMLGTQTPYIIAIRPRQSMPQGYNQFVGFPCNMTLKLGDCDGFTTVEVVHLENIKATQSEIDEIETLLMGGVIL